MFAILQTGMTRTTVVVLWNGPETWKRCNSLVGDPCLGLLFFGPRPALMNEYRVPELNVQLLGSIVANLIDVDGLSKSIVIDFSSWSIGGMKCTCFIPVSRTNSSWLCHSATGFWAALGKKACVGRRADGITIQKNRSRGRKVECPHLVWLSFLAPSPICLFDLNCDTFFAL